MILAQAQIIALNGIEHFGTQVVKISQCGGFKRIQLARQRIILGGLLELLAAIQIGQQFVVEQDLLELQPDARLIRILRCRRPINPIIIARVAGLPQSVELRPQRAAGQADIGVRQ